MSDDEIIKTLTEVKGIGRWTAEMFLIFSLGRPDVWPADDLGLRKAVQKAYRLREMPLPRALVARGERGSGRSAPTPHGTSGSPSPRASRPIR